ncbi:MAG: 4-hydroxythreonine-4-phosphate dehydrogenase PdxA, partial [Pseudomonadota bacterium]
MNAPRARPIAVSLGDPAGIGPEITVKARAALGPEPRLLAIGDPATLAPWAEAAGLRLTGPEDAPGPDTLAVLAEPLAAPPRPGQPDPANAAATIAGIRRGAEMAGDGRASALVTAPINKAALIAGAGFAFPGHTEFLAHLSDTPRPVMMLAGPDLRVVPVTIHIPLAEVPARLTPALLEETLRVTEAGLRRDF